MFCNINCTFSKYDIKTIESNVFYVYKRNWCNDLNANDRNKLRNYRLFRQEYD